MEAQHGCKWKLAQSVPHFLERAGKVKTQAVLFCTEEERDLEETLLLYFSFFLSLSLYLVCTKSDRILEKELFQDFQLHHTLDLSLSLCLCVFLKFQ